MIVKMKKVTLLSLEKDKESFLSSLRALGVVHIKNVTTPPASSLETIEGLISDAKNAIEILEANSEENIKELPKKNLSDAPEIAREIIFQSSEKKRLVDELIAVEKHIEWYKTWGSFNPSDIDRLKSKGIFVRLYRKGKNAFKKLKTREDIHFISQSGQYVFFTQVTSNEKKDLFFDEIKPLEKSQVEYCQECESLRKRIDKINARLNTSARLISFLGLYLKDIEKKHTFLNVLHGMKEEEKFSYLQGFCPIEKIKDLMVLAKRQKAGYLIEDPENSAEVPTLIRNPKWIKIIKPVFQFMNTIPGYGEYDISLCFLLFFSVFFAMLIGDAGYGLLFLTITFLARIKFRKAKPEPFILMYVLSCATIVWGAITGTWFGFEGIAKLPFFNSLIIERINSFVGSNQQFMIYMCFVIGVIQLTIAHLTIAFKKINSLIALSEIGWVLVLWGLFFTAGTLVIEKEFPHFAGNLFIIGISLIVLFSNPQKNILKGIIASLANLPLKVVSSFADIVSYLRLFAVGYASTVLASTFNELAIGVGFDNTIATLSSALILFFGHMLNIILGFMAVIVHGVRLNMLEFSGQMGMEWSGKEYKPFCES